MADYLRQKLDHFVRLSADDQELLSALSRTNVRNIGARRDIIREGERPKFVNLLIEGWAIRYKVLVDGRRQIIAFLLPGDICDLNMRFLREMDHSIATLTDVTIAQLPLDLIDELVARPSLAKALLWDTLVQSAIQREWIVSLGQRSALERVAQLICELFLRLNTVGLCVNGSCRVPVTQAELAEVAGITPVHVNRTLQELRNQGLVEWKGREILVPDMEALRRISMFNASYLHLS